MNIVNVKKTVGAEFTKEIVENINGTKLFKTMEKCQVDYPGAALIRGSKNKYLSYEGYKELLEEAFNSKELKKNDFPYMFTSSKEIKIYNHGTGFLLPIKKGVDMNQIICGLKNAGEVINKKKGKKVYQIDKAKDGPCESGRKIIVSWKRLPPQLTVKDAIAIFQDFGTVKNVKETKNGFITIFSEINYLLPTLQLLYPEKNTSRWFRLNKDFPTLIRFDTRETCAACVEKGHHCSMCPHGFVQKKQEFVKAFNQPSFVPNPVYASISKQEEEDKTGKENTNKDQNQPKTSNGKKRKKKPKKKQTKKNQVSETKPADDSLVDSSENSPFSPPPKKSKTNDPVTPIPYNEKKDDKIDEENPLEGKNAQEQKSEEEESFIAYKNALETNSVEILKKIMDKKPKEAKFRKKAYTHLYVSRIAGILEIPIEKVEEIIGIEHIEFEGAESEEYEQLELGDVEGETYLQYDDDLHLIHLIMLLSELCGMETKTLAKKFGFTTDM